MTAGQLIVVGYKVCPYCGGNSCGRCDQGEIAQTAYETPDPACKRCGEQQQEELTWSGLCRPCDYEDDLADGFIPSHSGGVRGGPQ